MVCKLNEKKLKKISYIIYPPKKEQFVLEEGAILGKYEPVTTARDGGSDGGRDNKQGRALESDN